MTKLLATAAALALAFAMGSPAFAAGKKTGFDTEATQGSGGKTNESANPENEGQTIISGPHGQVKQGKTANTTVDLPGKNR
jgi:hypothetical protein